MSLRALAVGLLGTMCALQAHAAGPAAALADVDPSNDDVVAPPEPIVDCEAKLREAGWSSRPRS